MKKLIVIGLAILLLSGCVTASANVISERIEKDILSVSIGEFRSGWDGFQQITVNIRNNSNQDVEFSAQSFFEDKLGKYQMIFLPSKLNAGSSRPVQLNRTHYRGEGSVSFGFTGNFWGISGFELDSGSGWVISRSDLNVYDVYMTLVFKVGNEIYRNTYHFEHSR